jgi:hypothetical protein
LNWVCGLLYKHNEDTTEKTSARAPLYCAFIIHRKFRKEVLGTENILYLNDDDDDNDNNNNNSLILFLIAKSDVV